MILGPNCPESRAGLAVNATVIAKAIATALYRTAKGHCVLERMRRVPNTEMDCALGGDVREALAGAENKKNEE